MLFISKSKLNTKKGALPKKCTLYYIFQQVEDYLPASSLITAIIC